VASSAVFGQDSLTVSFSEETDTLVKQRFIDRYENVFMTKVPTRHIFKLSKVGSELSSTGAYLAYEHKIRPSWSVELGVFAQTTRFNMPLYSEIRYFRLSNVGYWGIAKTRWYPYMNSRIRSGLNSNNFNGMYLGLNYEQSFKMGWGYWSGYKITNRAALTWGFQSRFLNRGHIDISLNLYNREHGFDDFFFKEQGYLAYQNFFLTTNASLGLAIGDWKRKPSPGLCDILVCDEQISGQWKLTMPEVLLGLYKWQASSGISYEKKIGKTPFSIEPGVSAGFQGNDSFTSLSTSLATGASLGLRYYLLEKFLFRRGLSGQNFSGPYLSAGAGYSFSRNRNKDTDQPEWDYAREVQTLGYTTALGFQQRFFKRFFIDGYVSYGWTRVLDERTRNTEKIYTQNFRGFNSNFSVGFTF